jgi:hypothetical protein
MASPLNINGTISFFNKFFSSIFFFLLLLRVFCSPLDMDGHRSINLKKHITFEQRSPIVNVLLLLHVGITHFD